MKTALLGDGMDEAMLPHSDLLVASTKIRNNNKKRRSTFNIYSKQCCQGTHLHLQLIHVTQEGPVDLYQRIRVNITRTIKNVFSH